LYQIKKSVRFVQYAMIKIKSKKNEGTQNNAGMGVAQAAPEQQKDAFLADSPKDLAPGPEDGAKMRWLKPGLISLSRSGRSGCDIRKTKKGHLPADARLIRSISLFQFQFRPAKGKLDSCAFG
jgi:hypothetical protein